MGFFFHEFVESFSEMVYPSSASTILQQGVPQLSFALRKGTPLIALACRPLRVIWWLAGLAWEETMN